MKKDRSKLERNKRVKKRRRTGKESLHPHHPRERASSRSSTRTMSPKDNKPKKPPKDSMTLLPCFYFVELPIVASSMISLYFLELTDVLQPVKSGFRCYDQSLSKPYVETGDELIPLLMLLSLAFAGPAASMYFNATISDSTKLLKPVLVFIFAIAAALASLTQITQYRSHPVDVYVGFVIGAGIAVYLAIYAVGNFKPSMESCPRILKKPPPPQKDALHALTQRGHDSVYQKAHASESNDELAAPVDVAGLNRKVRREKASMGSLKRASADVELLAPRNPMGKETMLTFSNTLPRASANANGMEEPAQRHMTFHVPSSKQLVSEWKQKSLEMRTLSLREDGQQGGSIEVVEETNEESKENLDMDLPTSLYPSVQAAGATRVSIPQRPGSDPGEHVVFQCNIKQKFHLVVTPHAIYAVGNFKPSMESCPRILKKPPPPQKDALHALTQRGHDSVYQKAHASESNDELAAPVDVAGLNRKVRREKASMGSLKRASADVELLAPRNPMGKETMLTFSNTLPRASANANGMEEPAQRHMTFHVPSSKQLVSEWKQKSLEMRTLSLREDGQQGGSIEVVEETNEESKENLDMDLPTSFLREDGQQGGSIEVVEETNEESKENLDMDLPTSLYPSVQAAGATRVSIPQRPGAPQLVHIPEEASKPPPVSPKSATTRAKWLSMMEKSPVPAATPEPPRLPNKPLVMQVTSTPKSSETASSCATSSIASSTESPYFRMPSERDSCSIVTVDAHAPHHPVVRLSSVSSNTWDWRSSTNGSTEVQETSRTMPRKEFRPAKTDSFGSEPPPHPDLVPQFHRKPSISAREWDPGQPHPEPDHFFKHLHLDQRFKDANL
ncbi:hypothetical protein PDJAM_G00059350 [Pangasius djambal]|uniref:Uncharacterized protein n=1 Tax=Pangasius djambal TaxID=1691987 RepID=A0ACC5YYP1_9TELE|nr:hypothetical protein [Pangasius djambal]